MRFYRRPRVWLGVAILVAAALTIPIALRPEIKRRLIAAVGERFDSAVEIESISIAMLPRPRVIGRGLRLRHKHRTDVPPLITIASFSAESSLTGLLRTPLHVASVTLEGLEINVPPGGMDVDDDDDSSKKNDKKSPLVVEHMVSERALLRILRSKPGKLPRLFEIHHLVMEGVGADVPWPFRADLTNPKPPGNIQTNGTFGPWNAEDPSNTALAAEYRFDKADLGVFKGIQGILSSTGKFSGVLERIVVDGETSVPDFALSDVGNPVALKARFHSIVDGTNGNTLLQPVDGTFLGTSMHTWGGVVERDGEQGRTVTLDVDMPDALLQDVLRLAVKGSTPVMSGKLKVKASLVLPPGHLDVVQKLDMNGTFEAIGVSFNKPQSQARMNAMSSKARGEPDQPGAPVASNFTGAFKMRDGVINFSKVTFSMPGVRVNVAGSYVMKTENVDFRGTVHLAARLSKMTTGMKSFVLRMFDGLFRHDDVTVIPIRIGGAASHPSVKLDFGKVLKGN